MNTIIKKWLKALSCLALTLFISSGVQAGSSEAFLRANQLYSLCSSESKLDNAVCEGYIIGVNDSVFSGHLSNVFQVCYPAGVTIEQLRLILVKYMETVPDKLHFVAEGIVAEGLATVFQCQVNESN
jgi:hypothetical protein